METVFLVVVVFLLLLAIFDIVVGVSNDAVNFMSAAVGSKAGSFKLIVAVSAIGIFCGAAFSSGMIDVARHGIFNPVNFSFYDVMVIFLAVMVADILLLDLFNSLGMPTSTTVSMVFELLGGAFVLSIIKIAMGTEGADGSLLGLEDYLNSEKALSVIVAIFVSVAIAFVFGVIVQWLSRVLFTFTYEKGSKLKMSLFGGFSVTCIIWFLLIKGMKGSSLMTPELDHFIKENTWGLLSSFMVVSTVLMFILSYLKVNVLKIVVMLGTFALAMAFAGNDLVNFVGVPLTGLESYLDFTRNSGGLSTHEFMMGSLAESGKTSSFFLVISGIIMVLSLVFSKKAQNVVKTSVGLSSQEEGDELFGSSSIARGIVRNASKMNSFFSKHLPKGFLNWIDSRFNITENTLPQGAAFDLVRAAVNLVLASLLVALGTSWKLPLSTTYVTFMVTMGTSLADRAWSRESAVFRITGVVSVIGGWFVTAGAAFLLAAIFAVVIYFGGVVMMFIVVVASVILLIHNNKKFGKKKKEEVEDVLFKQIVRSKDLESNWTMLCQHVREYNARQLEFVAKDFSAQTSAFFEGDYKNLKKSKLQIEEQRRAFKRQRRLEIISLRHVDSLTAIEHNTWYFLANNSVEQLLFCLKRINDSSYEHVANNFSPVDDVYAEQFIPMKNKLVDYCEQTVAMLKQNDFSKAEEIRNQCSQFQSELSVYRKQVIDDMQKSSLNIDAVTVYLNMVQESQTLLSSLRHLIRGMLKLQDIA